MTLRKPRPAAVPIPPLPRAVPYPPDTIWRAWQDGLPTMYRGNLFKRQGHQISRVIENAPRSDGDV